MLSKFNKMEEQFSANNYNGSSKLYKLRNYNRSVITQLPVNSIWIKGILALLSIPVVMNVVLSYERSKISN